MVAHPLPAAVRLDAGEDVETGLKPVGEALRDLERLVHSVIRRCDSVNDRLRAFCREIAMQFDHRGAGLDCVIGVDLDLVAVLRHQGQGAKNKKQKRETQSGGRSGGKLSQKLQRHLEQDIMCTSLIDSSS